MKRFINLKVVALVALFMVVTFAAGVFSASVEAHEGHSHEGEVQAQTTQAQAQTQPRTQTSAEVTYQYVAQPGDSFSLIARKAVQTYGLSSKTRLSHAQIIYVETNLTREAGSPELNEGQKVGIEESRIKAWVEKAAKLSAAQQQAWSTYAQLADFNTDHVGQAAQAHK
jgi:hypothetical protein